ncbi:enoyl-CoA delta isomerase 1, mitochondrial-like [Apostichopus japonicus]|uniref:enoyl-CoA delta isomerase 1, mitochondrial-like n=1 Tax=Stichopus japonicus TaxID=307972 RepID=UPI003AB33884
MILAKIGRFSLRPSPIVSSGSAKWFASGHNYVTVEPDSEMDNVAIVKMQKKPFNVLCTDMLQQLTTTFQELPKEKKYKAAILTSNIPGVFSAGLDIMSVYGRTSDEIYSFAMDIQNAWIALYGNPMITVAGINGTSPAAGCLLALSCDHRIMAEGKFGIGFNETKVGFVPRFWMKNTMQNVIGFRKTEKALQEGTLFTPSQAKEIGLVDVVAPMDQIIPSCRDFIKQYLKLPYGPRSMTKQMLRQDTIKQLKSAMKEDAEASALYLSDPAFQKVLGSYVAAMSEGKA